MAGQSDWSIHPNLVGNMDGICIGNSFWANNTGPPPTKVNPSYNMNITKVDNGFVIHARSGNEEITRVVTDAAKIGDEVMSIMVALKLEA